MLSKLMTTLLLPKSYRNYNREMTRQPLRSSLPTDFSADKISEIVGFEVGSDQIKLQDKKTYWLVSTTAGISLLFIKRMLIASYDKRHEVFYIFQKKAVDLTGLQEYKKSSPYRTFRKGTKMYVIHVLDGTHIEFDNRVDMEIATTEMIDSVN